MTASELGPLTPGARVAIVAPSGPPPSELLARSLELLDGWGLEPVVFPSATATHPRARYLAGPDVQRAADLQSAWCDTTVDAVFCARGGYGSVRMIDLLDRDALAAAPPKPLYGSSDVTGIHEYWLERIGLATWFTPMTATAALLDDAAAIESLRRAVFEPVGGRRFTAPTAETLVAGEATGRIIGGNLSLLAMTLGAHGLPVADHTGCIALLEDVEEEPYRLDGLLTSLLRAGWFDGVTGIALGSWQGCGDLGEVRALAEELLAPLGVPLVWELGFGHGPHASSIPLGVRGTLVAGSEPELVIEA
ncbi:muramoyltetrapeptide carboxypeptidase [Agromyces hippuratus]|uniref:Muramoyltetrapeptide carboxypeptidase n=1 Tax=Agromyces hippuratus TaxID=286438 RepID=A0A852WWR4_9MICO|nr:LD-carboxypeptidase [Agromyces hippuratus]NYG22782.1 muramoyltetrapeptide carboxypeptidase [Agromyces hippuratus]